LPKKKEDSLYKQKVAAGHKLHSIWFNQRHQKKFETFLKNSTFGTMAEFIREAMNVYIDNPDIRDPTLGDKSVDEFIRGSTAYYDQKEQEDQALQLRLDTLERKLDLLLQDASIKEASTEIEEALFDETE
jgi:hypothetical protein